MCRLLELAPEVVELRDVDLALALEERQREVVPEINVQLAKCRGNPGELRHEDLGNVQVAGNVNSVHRSGAAKGHEREVTRIVTLLQADQADRVDDVRVCDPDDRRGRLFG